MLLKTFEKKQKHSVTPTWDITILFPEHFTISVAAGITEVSVFLLLKKIA